MQERTLLQNNIDSVSDVENILNDNVGLIEMGEEEGDDSIIVDAESELSVLKEKSARMELSRLPST